MAIFIQQGQDESSSNPFLVSLALALSLLAFSFTTLASLLASSAAVRLATIQKVDQIVWTGGNVAAGVLVQRVGGVSGITEPAPTRISPGLGRGPIANIIKSILKLLAGHWRRIAPRAFAAFHLPQRVIIISPGTPIRQGHPHALIRRIVGIIERERRITRGHRAHRGESIQMIE